MVTCLVCMETLPHHCTCEIPERVKWILYDSVSLRETQLIQRILFHDFKPILHLNGKTFIPKIKKTKCGVNLILKTKLPSEEPQIHRLEVILRDVNYEPLYRSVWTPFGSKKDTATLTYSLSVG